MSVITRRDWFVQPEFRKDTVCTVEMFAVSQCLCANQSGSVFQSQKVKLASGGSKSLSSESDSS